MNENRHPIDDLFRDGLSQHSVEPPMHVWDRIDQTRTPVYKLVNNFKQNSRWYLSIAAGLVLMSSAAIMYLSDESQMALVGEGNKPVQTEAEIPAEAGKADLGTGSIQNPEPNKGNEASTEPSEPEAISGGEPSGFAYDGEEIEEGIAPVNPFRANTNPSYPGRPGTSVFGTEKHDEGRAGDKGTPPAYVIPPVEEEIIPATPKEILAVVPPVETPEKAVEPPAAPEEIFAEVPPAPEVVPAPEKVEDKTTIPLTPSPWAIEFLASYDVMNRSFQNASSDYVRTRKEAEKMGAAYTFQLRAQYRLSPLFAIRSGISFSQHHEKLNFSRTDTRTEIVERQENGFILDPINGPTPITYTVRDTFNHTSTISANANNTYTFVDIPVLLNYTFYTSNKWDLGVSGGPMFNMVFNQKGKILGPVNNEIIDLNSPANPFRSFAGVNMMLNVSASYQLCNHFDLLVEPGIRYGMSSLTNKEFGVAQKYSSVNIFTGLRYRF